MELTNYILTPEDVDLIRQAVDKVLGRSISYAGQIALENLTNTEDLRNNVQIIIGESVQSGAGGLTITFNPTTGITTFTLDPDLSAVAALASLGFISRTANGAMAARTLIEPAAGIDIANPAGIAGDPTFILANDLAALEALNASGLAVRTANDAWALRSITATTGLAVIDGNGVAGNPTVTPANDLAAIESLSSTGFAVRTGTETWEQRSITGASGQIFVVDGDGVAGNPLIALDEVGTPGTYQSVTTDAYGRVTSGESGMVLPVVTKSANYTATSSDYAILCSATLTLSLPAAASNTGRSYALRNTGAGTVTIDPNAAELIDGATTKSLAANEVVTIVCDGTQWFTIG